MLSRGARKFVFLGRTGADKPLARRLIADLECQGATCSVVRGDVSVRGDVDAMVAAVDGKIGGVIQAAMGLHVRLSHCLVFAAFLFYLPISSTA